MNPRTTTIVCATGFALGILGWILCGLYADADRAWRALLIAFIFFSPLASGMAVWPGVVLAARGHWSGPANRWALAAAAFAPVSIATYCVLWIGRSHWAAFLEHKDLPNASWLRMEAMIPRDLIALTLLWTLAIVFARCAGRSRPRKLAGWLVFIYGATWTLLGFDVVMSLKPHWYSALFGGYVFVSGAYAALAAWTLTVLISDPKIDKRRLHDLGKLLVGFGLLTTYMMYSQLIVLWYGNLEHEVSNVIPRLHGTHWATVSKVMLATIYLGPLGLLLARWAKMNRQYLGGMAVLLLAGLWVERWWLVTPALGGALTFGFAEASLLVAYLAALVGCINLVAPHLPAPAENAHEPQGAASHP